MTRNIEQDLLQYIRSKKYEPSTMRALRKAMEISSSQQQTFAHTLDKLVQEKKIQLKKGHYLPPEAQLVSGIISVHAKGFAFVKAPPGPDIFIPRHATLQAVDGDTVEVQIISEESPKGPEGAVITILSRGRTHLACTLFAPNLAYSVLLSRQVQILGIEPPLTSLNIGDRLICKVSEWGGEKEDVQAVAMYKIGHIDDALTDIPAAIEEFELPNTFSQDAIDEADNFPRRVTLASHPGRRDLTDLETVTIDPDTARDFDDAISLTKDDLGHFHLGVHIADAAYYVRPGSMLDEEACKRCNSTYFPGQCVPMLPEALSNELCSLKPNVVRLTVSVLAEFSPTGELIDFQICRSAIKSRKRFTYHDAFEVLERRVKSPHLPLLDRMVELCRFLKQQRFQRGSIDFSLAEQQLILDERGEPVGFQRIEYDITHQMIEEFMLKANELVAIHLNRQGKQLIYRIHDSPSEDSFQDFFAFARALGFSLPPAPTRGDIQDLFLRAKDSPLHQQLSIQFVRSMRLAAYSPDNIGHYGLALEHYCHFTSPIRRYTDTIIQRLLLDEISPSEDLHEIAQRCSERERISWKAEMSVKILKKLRLANRAFKEDPMRLYLARITQIRPFALFFEVPQFDLEGSFHVSELGDDFYEYNPIRMVFHGVRTKQTFVPGQEIQVRLEHIDLIHQKAIWISPSQRSPRPKRNDESRREERPKQKKQGRGSRRRRR